jgi:ABC-2 type transport system permease protein
MKLLRDTSLIYRRSMKQTLRQPVWVAIGLLQPLMFLFLFGPLLENVGAPGIAENGAWNVFVPGLLVQIALFAGVFAGFGLVAQIRTGVLERFRVTPVSRTALLFGFALRDVTILVVQALLLMAIAIPLGLHIDIQSVAITLLVLALVGLALGSGSYVIALLTKSEEALAPITNTISMPLLLLSGIFLPMALAPVWLQAIANANPLLHAVDAVRAVFLGHPNDPAVGFGIGLFAVLAALGLWGAGRMFGRSMS